MSVAYPGTPASLFCGQGAKFVSGMKNSNVNRIFNRAKLIHVCYLTCTE